jgi:3-demethoxyubiquinol 3-hydroxylase
MSDNVAQLQRGQPRPVGARHHLSMTTRSLSRLDHALAAADQALRTLGGAVSASRPAPSAAPASGATPPLSEAQRRESAALMRVNHVGEVCAQALYQAQALMARTPERREHMLRAAQEELDHLAWTQQRLKELKDRPSLLNPLWFAGAFAIGLAAGRAGDAISLGFVVETERQVEDHLAGHLNRLPAEDTASHTIVEQMRQDEARHGQEAREAGAAPVPAPIQGLMKLTARVMTTTAHWI